MTVSTARTGVLVLAAVVMLALHALPGLAVDTMTLRLGSLQGAGWSMHEGSLQFVWQSSDSASLELHAARLVLPAPLGEFADVTLACSRLQLGDSVLDCLEGELRTGSGVAGRQRAVMHFRYDLHTQALNLDIRDLRWSGGRLQLQAHYSNAGWTASLQADSLAIPLLSQRLVALGYRVVQLEGDGRLDLHLQAQGVDAHLQSIQIDLQVQDASCSDASGRLATEHAALQAHLGIRSQGQGWLVSAKAESGGGAWYFDPLYLALDEHPLQLAAELFWTPAAGRLELRNARLRQPDVLDAQLDGVLLAGTRWQVQALQAQIHDATLPAFYDTYLQPWLVQGSAGRLQLSGHATGAISIVDDTPVAAHLVLQNIGVEQGDGLFGWQGVNGALDWSLQQPRESVLRWQSGHVFRITLGATELKLSSVGRRVGLLEPVELPVLDGALHLDTFELEQSAGETMRWKVDGLLTPISLEQLTAALDWPRFGGKLSGVIPQVSYQGDKLTVDGVLLVRVFDGEVTLSDLQLEQPLGTVPRLHANVRVHGIDLEPLTRTFSFGRIEGRLDGRVEDLEMVSWVPVAFDAEFATPADDRSRHRISQKAVDTISNIGGGGVGGALSRSFLRFLEDFPYDRLGIRCRLQAGVCAMGGVAPAANGYYLVKGRFLPPRLDVIGYSERVDWAGLVAQLQAATRGGAAQVR